MATKLVQWEVQPLENLSSCKAYLLRELLNRGEAMSREDKDWLCEAVNSNTYFRTAVPNRGATQVARAEASESQGEHCDRPNTPTLTI